MERRDLIRRVLGMFPPGSCVDLGTGHGGYAILAADLGWEVTAVDARTERWPDPAPEHIRWVQGDVRDVPLDSYDLVLCLGLFYHLTIEDQLAFLGRVKQPVIIDTALDHGTPPHKLSDRSNVRGYTGRFYDEPGKTTSSWGNDRSFWPTLAAFYRMLKDCGFPVVLTVDPWVQSHRGVFVALPEG